MKDRKTQIRNSIYGFVIGDCLGVPYEFTNSNKINKVEMVGHGSHDQPAGTWSDDTSFMLATLDCEFDNTQKLTKNLKSVLKGKYTVDNHLFDVGYATSTSLLVGGDNRSMQDGNGSLMRILPYAFLNFEHNHIYDEKLTESSFITHNSGIAAFCCVVYCDLVKNTMLGNDTTRVLESLYNTSTWWVNKFKLDEKRTVNGYVWHSLLIVNDIIHKAKSFDDGIKMCIELGGDTDTHCALVGGILALKFNDWKKHLKNVRSVHVVDNIIDNFLENEDSLYFRYPQ